MTTISRERANLLVGLTKAEIYVEINGVRHTRSLPIPEQYWDEAERRMISPPTPDGLRHCLNRCFLPFYAWVREQTRVLFDEKIAEHLAMHPEDAPQVPAFDDAIPAHPHVPTAPHWFVPQLQES